MDDIIDGLRYDNNGSKATIEPGHEIFDMMLPGIEQHIIDMEDRLQM
jgi:hypothetical protein